MATAGQFTQWYLGTYSMYPSAAAPRGRGRGERLLPPRSSVPGAEPRGRGRGGSEQGRRRPPPRAWGLAGGRGRGRRPPPQGLDATAPLCSAQPATLPAGRRLLDCSGSAAGVLVCLLEYPRGRRTKGSTMERW